MSVRMPQDSARKLLDVHEFVKADGAQFVVEEKIDIGIFRRFAARSRAEKIRVRHPGILQIGLGCLQSADRFIAPHALSASRACNAIPSAARPA